MQPHSHQKAATSASVTPSNSKVKDNGFEHTQTADTFPVMAPALTRAPQRKLQGACPQQRMQRVLRAPVRKPPPLQWKAQKGWLELSLLLVAQMRCASKLHVCGVTSHNLALVLSSDCSTVSLWCRMLQRVLLLAMSTGLPSTYLSLMPC